MTNSTILTIFSNKEMKRNKEFFQKKNAKKPPFKELQNLYKCEERGVIMMFIRAKCGFLLPKTICSPKFV